MSEPWEQALRRMHRVIPPLGRLAGLQAINEFALGRV
jgi:hypothetical protein